jgi:hypothetical protein
MPNGWTEAAVVAAASARLADLEVGAEAQEAHAVLGHCRQSLAYSDMNNRAIEGSSKA